MFKRICRGREEHVLGFNIFCTKLDDRTPWAGHFWVVYGKKGSELSIVTITVEQEEETSKVLYGNNCHKYSLYDDDCVDGMSLEDLKNGTLEYCVLSTIQ